MELEIALVIFVALAIVHLIAAVAFIPLIGRSDEIASYTLFKKVSVERSQYVIVDARLLIFTLFFPTIFTVVLATVAGITYVL